MWDQELGESRESESESGIRREVMPLDDIGYLELKQ